MENEINDMLFWLQTKFLNDNDGDVGFKSVKQPTFGVIGSRFTLVKAIIEWESAKTAVEELVFKAHYMSLGTEAEISWTIGHVIRSTAA
ncbi:hypothetical protein Tco_0485548 [Tanacetum coccineum]